MKKKLLIYIMKGGKYQWFEYNKNNNKCSKGDVINNGRKEIKWKH